MLKLPFFWEPFIDSKSPERQTYNYESCSISMPIRVDFDSVPEVFQAILGYQNLQGDRLHRKLPAKHPKFPWMYATGIQDIKHVKPIGKAGKYYQYRWTDCNVIFQTLPFPVLEDDAIAVAGDEHLRFCKKIFEPVTEVVSLDRGMFKFSDGKAFPGSFIPVPKANVHWTWYKVPHKYIMDANGIPTRINAAIGKVNLEDFAGYPAGTLLLLNPKLTQVYSPTNPVLLGLKSTDSPIEWQVDLPFLYDPMKHNNKPNVGKAGGTHYPWEEVTDAAGNTLYDEILYTVIFEGP